MRRFSVDARLEPLSDLLHKTHDAVRSGDAAAEARRVRRLHMAIAQHAALRRVPAERVGEVIQAVLVRVHDAMHAGSFDAVRDPIAWLARVIQHIIIDEGRARARRARRFVPIDDAPSDSDASGVHRIDRLRADVDAWLDRAAAFVAYYEQRAPRGAIHIRVWFELRVLHRDANELARAHGIDGRADGGRATIYQWAHRGASLLERIVREDADATRSATVSALLNAA